MAAVGQRVYWDGGLVSNTPLTHVVQHLHAPAATIFQVDLFSAHGRLPNNTDEVADRVNDIRYSSRTRAATDQLRKLAEQHRRTRALVAMLPPAQRDTPQVQQWLAEASDAAIDLVHLIRRPGASETSRKGYEFSRQTMRQHWAAGQADMQRSLAHLGTAGVATAPCDFRVSDFGHRIDRS